MGPRTRTCGKQRPWAQLVPLLVLALLLPGAAAQYILPRHDAVNANYVTAYLRWQDGKGVIAWDEEAPKDADPAVPPADSTDGADAVLAWNQRAITGTDAEVPRLEFVGQPIPDTYFLNASRNIQMDFYHQKASCGTGPAPYDVELWLGETFVTGTVHIANGGFVGGGYSPKVTPGYYLKTFRVHPELDVLPKGGVLRLVILQHDACGNSWGMGHEHDSIIRFAFYTPEEVVFRVNGVNPPGDEAGAGPEGSASAGAAFPFLLALAAPLLTRRGRAQRAAGLLLLAALAGCVGGPGGPASTDPAGTEPTGQVEATMETGPRGLAAPGNGSVAGQVKNDQNVPIRGAHVSLLNTPHSRVTDGLGQFVFPDLAPGPYKIRVDRDSYRSVEYSLKVEAGTVTKVKVTLEPLVKVDAGFRPHQHDDWEGKTSRVLSLSNGGRASIGTLDHLSCWGGPLNPYWGCWAPINLEFGELVLPGANDMEVKIDWDSGTTVDRMGFGFHALHDRYTHQVNNTWMYPKARGVPTHVRMGWEMTEVGHQKYSTMQTYIGAPSNFFIWLPLGTGGSATPALTSSTRATGTFTVTITLHKGVVPLEPPHRDFWGPNQTYQVMDQENLAISCTFSCDMPSVVYGWTPSKLVPPGTKWLDIVMEPEATTLPVQWGLYMKGANRPPNDPVASYRALTGKNEGGKLTFKAEVKDDEPDPFYGKASVWRFLLDDNNPQRTITEKTTNVKLTVVAHRDAMPS